MSNTRTSCPPLEHQLTYPSLVTLCLTICLLRASVALVAVFALVVITFFILAAADMTGNTMITKVGGGFGIAAGLGAMYVAMAGLLTNDTSFFTIPIGNLAPKN